MNENLESEKKERLRWTILVIFIILLIVLFFVFMDLNINPIISFLTVLFLFLVAIGPILSIGRGGFFKKLFKKKKRNKSKEYERGKEYFKVKSEPIPEPPQLEGKVRLDFTYNRPLITKCPNCGFTLTRSMKKCPICGKKIMV